jgi:hypothetical protein
VVLLWEMSGFGLWVEVVTAEKDLGIRASATLNLAAALCLWGMHGDAVRAM